MPPAFEDVPASLDALLALDDSRFIASAYQVLLGRPIDPAGFRDYDARLRGGTPRLQIVAELHQSTEGQLHGARLPGLSAALAGRGVPVRATAAPSSLRQLFRLHEEAFVDALVAALLRRPAREDERRHHAERLRAGVPKMALLDEFAVQADASACGALEGFGAAERALRAGLCPVALDLTDLLSFDDHAFVDCAYKTLIGRRPDAAGLAHYVSLLRAGHAKLGIALRLARSAEGRRRASRLDGLEAASRWYWLGRLPLVGRVVCAATGVESETPGARRLRAIENRLERVLQDGARARVDAEQAVVAVDDLLVTRAAGREAR